MSEELTAQGTEISIRDYLDLFRRRKTIIIQTFVVILVVGIVLTLLAKPVYRSGGTLLVETRNANSITQVDPSNPIIGLLLPEAAHDISTQIEVLRSSKLLMDAFEKSGVKPGTARLDVKEISSTDVLEYQVESSDPLSAERMAKVLPDTYRGYVTAKRDAEMISALGFTDARRSEEIKKLESAEQKLQNFRENRKLADSGGQIKAEIEKQADIEKNIRAAASDVAVATQAVTKLRNLRDTAPKFLDTPLESSNDKTIQQYEDKIASLQIDRAALSQTLSDKNLKVKAIDDQIARVKEILRKTPLTVKTVTRAPNPLLASLTGDIAKAEVDLASKQEALKRALANRSSADLSIYASLERMQAKLTDDVLHHRESLISLNKTFENLSLRSQTQHDPVTVLTPAGKAIQVAPRTANNILFAAVAGILLGVCFALLQEYLDDRINTPDDARKLIEAPILSYVPMVEAEEMRLLTRSRGGGSLLESYRVMRANVQFAAVDTTTSSIVVTSTSPGEGKSVTSSNLAVAMALDGRRVILVDADLRRPTLHEKFDVDQRPGLTNVLVGHTALVDALKETEVPGLRILTAGPLPPNPAELLNSIAMRKIHEELRELADVVIFDSPPFLATADSQVLAAMSDGVIYVVQFGEAKKSAVRHAVDLIHQAHARVLGVVFNKIDLTARRDDYYYGYYRYYNYYHTPQLDSGEPRRRRSTTEFDGLLNNGNGNAIDGDGASQLGLDGSDVAVVGSPEEKAVEKDA